ncbi:hypothetical protein F5Y17DRAFT_421968 [Xylariaceae sp. FL0594]|nr:hypothetical protein F5Y17DRAFT_421968 [Xylariaceae sp. FL0594]
MVMVMVTPPARRRRRSVVLFFFSLVLAGRRRDDTVLGLVARVVHILYAEDGPLALGLGLRLRPTPTIITTARRITMCWRWAVTGRPMFVVVVIDARASIPAIVLGLMVVAAAMPPGTMRSVARHRDKKMFLISIKLFCSFFCLIR